MDFVIVVGTLDNFIFCGLIFMHFVTNDGW